MGSWIVWLVLAALLGVAEVVTATLAFGLLAVAAVVAAIVSADVPDRSSGGCRMWRTGRAVRHRDRGSHGP